MPEGYLTVDGADAPLPQRGPRLAATGRPPAAAVAAAAAGGGQRRGGAS